MEEVLYQIIAPEARVERLRPFAQKHFYHLFQSNKGIKKAIEKGLFLVNGNPANTASMVKEGDEVSCLKDPNPDFFIYPLALPLVYEDAHCAVINKAAGLEVHNHFKRNVVNALPFNLKPCTEADSLDRPMPVHRLDKDTSGLLLVAKTRSFQVRAGRLFENKKIHKEYTAIVTGEVQGEGSINVAVQDKSAKTRYRSIRTRQHRSLTHISLVNLYPETGRTHQLRIHCAAIASPILGEKLYGQDLPNIKGRGLYLCATSLRFTHPISGKAMAFRVDLPKKFSRYF